MDRGTWLLALQRDAAVPNPGLSFYRSDDDGETWSFFQAIDPSPLERHTAEHGC